MIPHSDLVRFIVELYASQGVPAAKPLSECGQGLPVYAAGQERVPPKEPGDTLAFLS